MPAAYYAHIVVARCRALFDYEELAKSETATTRSGGSGGGGKVTSVVPVDTFRIQRALDRNLGMQGMWFM